MPSFTEKFRGHLPDDAACWKCIKEADAGEFRKTDQEIVACQGIGEVPEKLVEELPCSKPEGYRLPASGNFITQPEVFNAGDTDPFSWARQGSDIRR